jgi:hypothetical protein
MKSSSKTFALAVALLATAFTAAAGDLEIKKTDGFKTGMYATKSGRINVAVEKVSTDYPTTILLKNERGDVIYSETIGKRQQRFGRTLIVNDLSAGRYEIEVSSKEEKKTKTFEVSEPKTERVLTINP